MHFFIFRLQGDYWSFCFCRLLKELYRFNSEKTIVKISWHYLLKNTGHIMIKRGVWGLWPLLRFLKKGRHSNTNIVWKEDLKNSESAKNPSKSPVFCPKMSEWAIRSKTWAIHSFLVSDLSDSLTISHFLWAMWATWAIGPSFLVRDLSNLLTLIIFGERTERFTHIAHSNIGN